MTLISPGTAAYWWSLSVPLRYLIARQARSADSVDRAGTDQPDLA
jgi:hypothetical protein